MLEYFETAREAGPISDDERIMHRLTYNANNAKASFVLIQAFTHSVCLLWLSESV